MLLFAFASAVVAGAIAEQHYGFIALMNPFAVLLVWLLWLARFRIAARVEPLT